jgi:HSP20 family protein
MVMETKALSKTAENFPVVFEDFFKPWNEWFDNNSFWGKNSKVPAVNIRDTKENYLVSLAVPGFKKEDFKIDVEGNILTISSEKEDSKEEKKEKYTRKEYNYASFSRSFTLPENVKQENIDAAYKDGILELTLPKKEDAKKTIATKTIPVK